MSETDEVVEPLAQLAPGEAGRIVHIAHRDADRLVRLSSLGLIPGATVRLTQRRPAVVLSVGETTLALDPGITADIYVRRVRNEETS